MPQFHSELGVHIIWLAIFRSGLLQLPDFHLSLGLD